MYKCSAETAAAPGKMNGDSAGTHSCVEMPHLCHSRRRHMWPDKNVRLVIQPSLPARWADYYVQSRLVPGLTVLCTHDAVSQH